MVGPRSSKIGDLELDYLSILFAVGFAISFGQIQSEPWFQNPFLVFQTPYRFQFASILLVYLSIILSAWGVFVSFRHHPIKSSGRFLLTILILILYFPFFLKFKVFGSELFLIAITFTLFILWDYLKEREYPADVRGMRPRTWVTVTWTLIAWGVFYAYSQGPSSSLYDWGVLLIAGGVVVSYRFHKQHPLPFSRMSNLVFRGCPSWKSLIMTDE